MMLLKVLAIILYIVQVHWAKQFQLVWSPEANKDGLKAFEGVEDLSLPGHKVKHIMVEGNNYRFNIHPEVMSQLKESQCKIFYSRKLIILIIIRIVCLIKIIPCYFL